MPEITTLLGLPLVAPGQAQKHVPVNEALGQLDRIVQCSVRSHSLALPPQEAAEGDGYIVGVGASGEWAGRDGALAFLESGGWRFVTPREGWRCWVQADASMLVFSAGDWTAFGTSGEIENLTRFGFGTVADDNSPFVAKLNTALWTAQDGEGGTGDLRFVMNKTAQGNVLSLLMQSGYGGRAEIGLVGEDDFVFKVSAEGETWHEAIKIDRFTGRVRFPMGSVREVLASDRTFYVRTDGADSNTGSGNTPAEAFQTLQRAYDFVARGLDLAGYRVTIQMGAGTFAGLQIGAATVGSGAVAIAGAGPALTVLSGSGHLLAWDVPLSAGLSVLGATLTTSGTGDCIHAGASGRMDVSDVVFGACAGRHIAAVAPGAEVRAAGNYAVSGGAVRHVHAETGGLVAVTGRTVSLIGTPAFGAFAEATMLGCLVLTGNSFSGPASGQRYLASGNGVVRTGGSAGSLPGNLAGAVASGGQYL
jgi:hypothetical protein